MILKIIFAVVLYTTHLHINQKVHMACNFNRLLENEGQTGTYIGSVVSVSEMVQDGVVVTSDH